MDARYLIILVLALVGCESPNKSLLIHKPDFFEFNYSIGGTKVLDADVFDFEDDSMSKISSLGGKAKKGELEYKVIYDFLVSNSKRMGLFNNVEIPPRHVLLLFISYQGQSGNLINISVGKNWIAYHVPVDSLGESSSTIYLAQKKQVIRLLNDLNQRVQAP